MKLVPKIVHRIDVHHGWSKGEFAIVEEMKQWLDARAGRFDWSSQSTCDGSSSTTTEFEVKDRQLMDEFIAAFKDRDNGMVDDGDDGRGWDWEEEEEEEMA